VFSWIRKLLSPRATTKNAEDHYAVAEGSKVERCAIAGLMVALESDEVAAERKQLTQANQVIFMMGYECCMMWAIMTGAERVLNAELVQSLVVAMVRHLANHGWYKAGSFEAIWGRVQSMMPIAMKLSGGQDAPPPYPVAELMIALDQAGYHLDQPVGQDIGFGIYMFVTMRELSRATEAATRQLKKPE
jgi:hypothetical protein